MPRPMTDLTFVNKTVSARLRPAEYKEWVRLGGVAWLRQQLAQSIKSQESPKPHLCALRDHLSQLFHR
jgi:hypothetical protein